LIADRIIFLGLPINSELANLLVAQLLFLESVQPEKPITLYINSPGGSVISGLAIYDTMQYVQSPVHTTCVGLAASMGAVLLSAGEKGFRSALTHSRVMIHQPSGGANGVSDDLRIMLELMFNLRKDLYEILSKHTGKSYQEIEKDSHRDNWFRAEEAKAYGLVDHVLSRRNEEKNEGKGEEKIS
jgi:ATP-dependent Clp protease protease subunit